MNPENFNENTERVEFPDIAVELQQMIDVDQDMRERSHTEEDYWDYDVDANNTARLKEIIEEIGFPALSKVGKQGASNAWLLVQHADRDVAFQVRCLKLMKETSEGEIEKRHIAYLEDRVLLNQNKKQLYGTQFTQYRRKACASAY